jgi:hypothetical protein
MEITGRMPLPDEIAAIPRDWRRDVFQAGYLLQFQRDGLPEDE